MGNDQAKLAAETGFCEAEITTLKQKYDLLRQSEKDATHHTLDRNLFLSKFPSTQQDLADILFRAADTKGEGKIDFRDFCFAVAILSKGTAAEKEEFAFLMYDPDRKGHISKADLGRILQVFRTTSMRILAKYDESLPAPQDAAATKRRNIKRPEDMLLVMKAKAPDRVTRDEFHVFCLENPEVFEEVAAAFQALKHAASWDWHVEGTPKGQVKPSAFSSDCQIM
jgi:Ca2+-binding EF-hand superfamily protein